MSVGNHPAFPCEAQGDRSVPQEHDYLQNGVWSSKFPGLMIRDWLAAQAPITDQMAAYAMGLDDGIDLTCDLNRHALFAVWAMMRYEMADAMLAERSKAMVAPADHSKTLLNALTGLTDILATAESNASGNPEWEAVSTKINAARAAIAKVTGK